MTNGQMIVRVDDRLIHGQVLVGWASHHSLTRIIVGNDEIANNEWERNLLLMAAPDHIEALAISLTDTLPYFSDEALKSAKRTMVLLNSPTDLATLADLGLPPGEINFGGIHFDVGRVEYLPYIFLTPGEVDICKNLIERGFSLECRDLPTNAKYNLASILEERS